MPELKKVLVEQIRIPEVRVSSIHTEEQRALLASTIAEVGVVQDVVVRRLGPDTYELVAGKGRLQELVNAGQYEVDVKVIDADEKLGLIMNITENVARGSYDYISVSRAIRKLLNMGVKIEELEKIFPWRQRWIQFLEGLQDLPDDVVVGIESRKITPTHVQLALNLPTPEEVHAALRTAMNLEWDTGIFKTYVENRVEQISRAQQKARAQGQPAEIPAPNPEQLTQYKQCLCCGFQKPAEKVQAQIICEDCQNIARYVTANIGQEEVPLQTLYAALKAYYGARPPAATAAPSTPAVGPQA
jgi:ParB family chromosome partitioning protein